MTASVEVIRQQPCAHPHARKHAHTHTVHHGETMYTNMRTHTRGSLCLCVCDLGVVGQFWQLNKGNTLALWCVSQEILFS